MIVALFPLGNSATSEFYVPTFRNTLSVPSSYVVYCLHRLWRWNWRSVPKGRHI